MLKHSKGERPRFGLRKQITPGAQAWKFIILLALWFGGKMRFKEIQRNIPGITGKVLSKELKHLEEHGILTRTVYDTSPISVEYELTKYGKTLDKVILTLREWGVKHRKKIISR